MLKHPNIVTCYGYCVDQKKPSIVLELLDISMYDWIHSYPAKTIDLNTIARMSYELCLGMHYLHS